MPSDATPVQSHGAPISMRTALMLLALLAGALVSEGLLEAWQAAPPMPASVAQ